MNHLKYVVFACLFFLGALPANAQVTYDVYIGAGQSNFDGRGDVDDLTGELAPFAAPQVGTLIYYNNPPEPDPNDTLDQAITTNGFVTLEPGYSFLGPVILTIIQRYHQIFLGQKLRLVLPSRPRLEVPTQSLSLRYREAERT